MWKRLAFFAFVLAAAACGGDDKKSSGTKVAVEPTPQDAVAEVKLQLEDFRGYHYCELSFPKTCDDLPTAYVRPRKDDTGPFEIIFFNNQDINSTWQIFDYLTVDMETKAITVEGQFQWCETCGPKADHAEKGTPMWGVPK